jgi:hypothetical protein
MPEMNQDKITQGMALRQTQQDARDKYDRAAEEYGRFLDSLGDEELSEYVRVIDGCSGDAGDRPRRLNCSEGLPPPATIIAGGSNLGDLPGMWA